MKVIIICLFILYNTNRANFEEEIEGQCTLEARETCGVGVGEMNKYIDANKFYQQIQSAIENYSPCVKDEDQDEDKNCVCHEGVISRDLEPYTKDGITRQMLDGAAKYGTRYKVLQHRLFRDAECMFPARCSGIEHFLLRLLPQLPNMDLVVNTRDWPQLAPHHAKGPVFSFSKTSEYRDIMYPAWTFWAGGPAISLHPTGIGRWDLLRERITLAAAKTPWPQKDQRGFFRGSRTSDERDSLVLLSRRKPQLVDAKYTKNQAWKSSKDTLNADPASEVSFEEHCRYKYLFNFRGVAASFRLKHLFLCRSLVFHVGNEWNEFFYFALKPWVHYVPLEKYPSEEDIQNILEFFGNHDDLAHQIADRGYLFILKHLRMEDVECYWEKLLTRYQKLLSYKVEGNKDLIEIKTKV